MRNRMKNDKCRLVYPTGESVTVRYSVISRVDLGKFSFDFPFYVCDMKDDCLLGKDFLSEIGLSDLFRLALGINSGKDLHCARI